MLMAATGDRPEATRINDAGMVQAPSSKAACSMTKTNGIYTSYFSGFEPGMGNYTYFNPEVECAVVPAYPFEITAFSFTLTDFGGCTWPALVDIVVYDVAASGDSCDGPGAELCRHSVVADQASFMEPTVGTFDFPPGGCCVDGPFFIGLEYTGGAGGSNPSICFDDNAAPDTCDNWFLYQGTYYEWYDIWTQPGPGYPLFWVDGETNSANCDQLFCDWQPGDPYKHHFPQMPDEEGWAVNATQPMILAEDFMCMDSGYIKDFHFWGAWKGGLEGVISSFVLSIHEDIPAEQNPNGYSKPGTTLWELEVDQFDFTPIDPPTMEGWYDPSTGEIIPDDHYAYWQYNICLQEADWFWQDSGTIYWVNISAIVDDPTSTTWGWKSTQDHWNDDAVWAEWGDLSWVDIWEPTDPIMNNFWIAFDPSGAIIPAQTGGVGYYPPGDVNGWWLYAQPDWEFWNIWFYDHPFTYDRQKEAHIEFDIFELEPGLPSWITLVVNYSTDLWSLEGQPPGDSVPPLPGMPPELELLYIGRDTLYDGPVNQIPPHFIADWEMKDYNPEWVSIDVFGYNFIIPEPTGMIFHDCIGSLDLSLVVTGGEEQILGACCYDDGSGIGLTCLETTQDSCETYYGGIYEGDGTLCQGMEACCLLDGSCVMADAFCCVNELGGTPQGPGTSCTAVEACCMADGSCQNLDPLCCVDQGGVRQGVGTSCTGTVACCFPDGSCLNLDPLCCDDQGGTLSPTGAPACLGDINPPNGIDDACEAPEIQGACCLDDGSCQLLTQTACEAIVGATYNGNYTKCAGDHDGNGIDDACEDGWQPGDDHKMHFPQLPNEAGWDVNATYMPLGDDFMCMETGWIKDIHFWGSWKHGITCEITGFMLAIYSDAPAGTIFPYSAPEIPLWETYVEQFAIRPIDPLTPEGWYDPASGEVIPEDHMQYYQYDVYLSEDMWFHQDSGIVYWLVIWPIISGSGTGECEWGWKSSLEHWNDDAVWSEHPWPVPLGGPWYEMYEPPVFVESMDLSFVITGTCCEIRGDVNHDGGIDVADLTYLVAYLFTGGPPPPCKAEGDVNGDGGIDVADLTYLVAYLFTGGPPPPPC